MCHISLWGCVGQASICCCKSNYLENIGGTVAPSTFQTDIWSQQAHCSATVPTENSRKLVVPLLHRMTSASKCAPPGLYFNLIVLWIASFAATSPCQAFPCLLWPVQLMKVMNADLLSPPGPICPLCSACPLIHLLPSRWCLCHWLC